MKLFSWISIIFLTVFCALILALSVRGRVGNPMPTQMNDLSWKDNGPFELSPERGRYALTYSLIEDHAFSFSLPIARFATPDLGYKDGKYVSLFAPGVSYAVIPGFLIGKYFGSEQVGSYVVIALFALLNVLLIRTIAIRLGAHTLAATLGSLIFIFATPAFAYGVNLYQHHVSTFLILSAVYLLISRNGFIALVLIWLLFAASIPVDYPNLVLMAPIGLAALGKFILTERKEKLTTFTLKPLYIFSFLGVILPLAFFMWFNFQSYGNSFQISGTVRRVEAMDQNGKPIKPQGADKNYIDPLSDSAKQKKTFIGFFDTREMLNGFYIHFFSPDRGIIYYAPVVLFGIIGFVLAIKKKVKIISVLVGIIGANILLYSMWGDPWGGWAFGSRYLIPSYAILSVFIALLLTYWKRKTVFFLAFIPVAFYSIAVNTLGAITTSALPPQIQVLNLEKLSGIVQRYTYLKNWEFLLAGNSKSFVYQTFLSNHFPPVVFYQILTVSICAVVGGITFYYYLISRKGEKNV